MAKNIAGPDKNVTKNSAKIPFDLPLLGKYNSRTEWESACWRKISDSKQALDLLATSYERHILVMRAAVVERLASGKKYDEIAKELWLSPQTISSIKKSVTENNYRSYRERGKKERRKRKYDTTSTILKPKHRRVLMRTKYGTIHMPN